MNDQRKNQIKQTLKAKSIRRKSQCCKTFCLKIDESRLNKTEHEQLKMFFIEAKWLYNDILALNDAFNYSYKNTMITILDHNKQPQQKCLQFLPARVRLDLIKGFRQNIINLSRKKKQGNKVGKLKFKSNVNSICLYKNGITHKITGKNRIKVIGIKRHFVVRGLKQIQDHYEIANAKLLKKSSGYYIVVTCYEFISLETIQKKGVNVGLDFGIKNNITTSDGEVFNVSIGESEHLKRLQQKFARQKHAYKKDHVKSSNNAYKTNLLIKKEYEKIKNKKNDKANKIVAYLLSTYDLVFIQDEQLQKWHKDYGREIQHSCMGRIKSKLLQSNNVVMIDKWFPSTKQCYKCDRINEINLSDRTYICKCGLVENRDIKAAKTILYAGCKVPMESRDVKLVENSTSDV